VGGIGSNGSGDLFIAFSTANHIGVNEQIANVRMLAPAAMTNLFRAAADTTEEAILNALCMAETMTGKDGRTLYAVPLTAFRRSCGATVQVDKAPCAQGRCEIVYRKEVRLRATK
jgi:L-aminopeptidase/D-esterase-like protein